MSEEPKVLTANISSTRMSIPQFGQLPAVILDVTRIYEAEKRLHEAQAINPGTYLELEYVIQEAYRESRQHLSVIYYQITQAEKALNDAKSVALLDEYPEFLKSGKHKDSAQIRDAFLQRYKPYTDAQDRIDMLKALEKLFEGKVKVFENTSRYMKKEIDLIVRSGMDPNKYIGR